MLGMRLVSLKRKNYQAFSVKIRLSIGLKLDEVDACVFNLWNVCV